MLANIGVGVLAMMVCLLVQAGLLLVAARYYIKHSDWVNSPSMWGSLAVIAMVMLLLVLGNLLQAALWASVFMVLGEFEAFTTAFYHSLVNFATLGYGDIVMSPSWRLLGPLQAINGVLMIGISTAAIGTVTNDSLRRTFESRRKVGSDQSMH